MSAVSGTTRRAVLVAGVAAAVPAAIAVSVPSRRPGSAALSGRAAWVAAGSPRLRARRARAFTDSVGVQVHLTYDDTPYADVAAVVRALTDLGVTHVRDDLRLDRPDQHAALNRLAASGIRSNLILGAPGEAPPSAYVGLVGDRLRGVRSLEGTNEWDILGDPRTWPVEAYARQRDLFAAARRDPRTARLPVLGPSTARIEAVAKLAAVGPLEAVSDLGNAHAYGGGRPVSAVLGPARQQMRRSYRGQRFVITETGYHGAVRGEASHVPVPDEVAACYISRLFLECFRRRVARTFLYELLDEFDDPGLVARESHFGLLRHDLRPKPAYAALRTLLRLVEDGSRSSAPRRLACSVRGPQDLRTVVLGKADGTHLVALWRDVSVYDVGTRRLTPVRAAPVHLDLPSAQPIRVYRPVSGPRPLEVTRTAGLTVPLRGNVVVVAIGGRRSRDFARPLTGG